MKPTRTVFILQAFLLLFSCGDKKDKEPVSKGGDKKKQTQQVTGYIVRAGNIQESLQLSAQLLPAESTEIHAETSGIIQRLNIQEGSFVTSGTLLAKLNDDEWQAQLNKLRIQLQIAEKTEERNKELLKLNGISQQEYDLSYLQVNNIRADIELTKAQIRKTEIRAPYSGRLGLKHVSPGAYITPSTALTTIRQLQNLKLQFSVPDRFASHIRIGEMVQLNVPGKTGFFTARIYATESFINDQSRGMLVRCLIEQKDPSLMAGGYATITFKTTQDGRSQLIPTQAVIPQAKGKKVIMYKNGVAVFTDVRTGLRDASRVEILSGLSEGDTILVTGLMSVRPDSPVKLTKVD